MAKEEVERTIKDIDNTTEEEINVPPVHHKHFVARRGQIIQKISDECGGVKISFPRPNVDSDKVSFLINLSCFIAIQKIIFSYLKVFSLSLEM